MARPPLNLPSQSSGAGQVRFSAPQRVPGLPPEAQRALLDAFLAIQDELVRLSAPFTRVPLLDDVQETRDGQVVRGVGDGHTLVLPRAPAFHGVRVVLDDVASAVTVVAPDATEYTLPVAGVYDFVPASDGGETYETTPLLFSLLNVTSGVVLGRETAGAGPVEELSVGGGLELSSGLQIADLGVTTAKLANDAVTTAKLANMAQGTLIGRPAGTGTGDPVHLNAASIEAIVSPLVPGRLIAVTAYATAASGTHTFDSDATSAEVWVIGGGGGGGGANGSLTFAGGGGAGALNYAHVPAGSLPASLSYTVGAGGAAGGATPTSGGAGGASSVTISASVHTAGGGGAGGLSSAPVPGGGGTGTSGTFTVFMGNGAAGHYGQLQGATVSGGNGGDSAYGGGALGGNDAAGAVGNVGSGGSGAATTGGGRSGGAGGDGLIIVKEYA